MRKVVVVVIGNKILKNLFEGLYSKLKTHQDAAKNVTYF